MDTDIIASNGIAEIGTFVFFLALGFILGKAASFVSKHFAGILKGKGQEYLSIGLDAFSKSSTLLFTSIGLYTGLIFLNLGRIEPIIFKLAEVFITVSVALTLFHLVEVPARFFLKLALKTQSKMDDMLVSVISKTLKLIIVVLTVVQIAQIMSGEELSTILAGLGIGGLAVALAAQDTIKNFFGSLLILADKPFELGERINYDGHDGTIEEVGLRSTRIRRLDGHQVTVPNGELAHKPIHNIGRRPFIRRALNITITYDTPPEKVKQARTIMMDILTETNPVTPEGQELKSGHNEEFPPRVYFNDFQSTALNIFAMYWYFPPDYWDYMDYSQWVNDQILERFNAAGIDFAFPTQTVHVAGDPKRPLNIGVANQ